MSDRVEKARSIAEQIEALDFELRLDPLEDGPERVNVLAALADAVHGLHRARNSATFRRREKLRAES